MTAATRGASSEALLSKPRGVASFGRGVLNGMARVLPAPAYRVLFGAAFSVYRTSLRAAYARNRLRYRVIGDANAARRADAVQRVMPFSLVGARGLEATYDVVREVQRSAIPGCLVELGVAQGGSAALMRIAS